MAKIKSLWLRGSSQRLGGAVTYMLKGVQIARELAAKVDNPRTPKQMNQRVKLANVVAFYRANRPWMERLAFETKKQNWSTYNAFVSANFAANEVYLTKQEAAQGCCIVAPYRVTEGSMPSINVNKFGANSYKTNLYCGEVDPATATVAEVTEALLENNNGLAEGMQISFIVNYQQQANGIYFNIVRYFEVILSRTDTSTFASHVGDTHIKLIDGTIGFEVGNAEPAMGFAFILSQTRAGRTYVSTQNMVLTSNTTYNLFSSASHANEAAASYGAGVQDPFLAAGYQSGSNDNVEIPISILSAGIQGRNQATVGTYLGNLQGESAFGIEVVLSQTTEETPTAMTCGADGSNVTATSVQVRDGKILGSFSGPQWNPTSPITAVSVTLATGEVLTAQFSSLNDSPGGDVTE